MTEEKNNLNLSDFAKNLNAKSDIQLLINSLKADDFNYTIDEETGLDPVQIAAKSHEVNLAVIFITLCMEYAKNDVNVNIIDDNKDNLIHLAVKAGNLELVAIIADHSEKLSNNKNSEGKTPLMIAIELHNYQMVIILIECNADITIKNTDGKDALSLAREYHNKNIINEILYKDYENKSYDYITSYDRDEIEEKLSSITDPQSSPLYIPLTILKESNDKKILQKVNEEMINGLHKLKSRFPNFSEVIDYFEEQISLSLLTNKRILFVRPILIQGDSGVGKTRFLKELSKIINVPAVKVNCGVPDGQLSISGSNPVWSGSKEGKISEYFKKNIFANPIFILDEIDKMSSSSHGSDCYGPLYPLLEYDTAKDFSDSFLDMEFDCSNFIWVSTANKLNSLPDPILSRFIVFKINEPSREDKIKIINSIYEDVIKDEKCHWGYLFSSKIEDEVYRVLLNFKPREVMSMIMGAMGVRAKKILHSSKKNEEIILKANDFKKYTAGSVTRPSFG